MKKYPSVTIIILNFNGLTDTRLCLLSVIRIKYPNFKVIVVDNGSDNNEIALLSKEFYDKRIRWKRFNNNLGFAGGNNKIIKGLRSKYIFLLNNDTIVDPLCLRELIKIAELDKKIAVCQSKILSLSKKRYFEYAGAAGGFIDGLGYPYARGRIGFHLEEDIGQYDNVSEIFWASGAAMLIKKQILLKSGLLAEDFFFYHEETDLCWRIKSLGYKILFVPKSVVHHKGSGASKANFEKKIFFVHRNSLLLIARNISLQRLIWLLPLRIILDWASALFYLLTGKPRFVFSMLRAQISFALLLPNILKYRQTRTKINIIDVEKELFPLSVFWQYFVKNKRRFSEISGGHTASKVIYYKDMINIDMAIRNRQKIKTMTDFITNMKRNQ
jgi:GT2 family glycosyltransferase